MTISFVVPTFRRPEALRETLQALSALESQPDAYEIIVVDDGSGDTTPEVVHAFAGAPGAITYLAQQNGGVAKARNTGAAAARGELLIFLDDDILVEPDHIDRHLAVRAQYGDCLVNGHWEFSAATRAALEETPFGRFRINVEDWVKTAISKEPLQDGRLRPDGITAANLSISAARFHELGGFDEGFPFAGCEDQDFSYRAHAAGCTFVYAPEIRLGHNDERLTLNLFAARQRRGAHTAVYLVARHPEEFAERALVLENAPLTRFDPWRMKFKKSMKAAYSSTAGLTLAALIIKQLETHAPRARVLTRLYTMTLGAHIFLGIRDGLSELPEARAAVLEVMRKRYGNA
jgi:GT2 family glycosyltransferase